MVSSGVGPHSGAVHAAIEQQFGEVAAVGQQIRAVAISRASASAIAIAIAIAIARTLGVKAASPGSVSV